MADKVKRGKAAHVFAGRSEDRIDALAREVRSSSPNLELIRSILRHKIPIGAISSDGQSIFQSALQRGNIDVIRLFCEASEVDKIVRALLKYFPHEKQVLKYLRKCMATLTPAAARIIDPTLLTEAMSTFPEGDRLVQKLLEYGVPANRQVQWKLSDSLYHTPKSNVSAAFACTLDPGRTPVLKALLKQHERAIHKYTIPVRSFSWLAQDCEESEADIIPRDLSLKNAALYLGNREAFSELGGSDVAKDGSLHTAAMLALPTFVPWLLERHKANRKLHSANNEPHSTALGLPEFGDLIPLAVACSAQARPWCKVANAEGTFEDRRRRTMELLGKETDLSWRQRQKTVLHFAIDKGNDALTAMLEALDVANDAERDERYTYTDKDGIVYSPSMYIKFLLSPGKENSKMVRTLRRIGRLGDRMYRPHEPGPDVKQPEGACGLPRELEVKWAPFLYRSEDAYMSGALYPDFEFFSGHYR